MGQTRISGSQVLDGSISNDDIAADAAIDGSKLAAGSVTGSQLATGAAASNIGANELDGSVINDGTLTGGKLATGAAAGNLAAGDVTGSMLATGAAAGNLGTGDITEALIADGAVSPSKLAAGAAVANIGAGGISSAEIAAGAVDLTSQISGLLPTGNLNVSEGALVVGASGDSGASLSLSPGQIVIGDASGKAVAVTMSGDATIDSAGAVTVSVAGANFADNDIPTGTVDGSNDAFTLADTPVANSEHVYVNGLRMTPTADYSISGDVITFITPPANGSNLLVDYRY